ncbi:MAG: hypothetical protein AAB267_10015, partial [Candidatus Desantisbacteria bacterium]
DRDNVNAAGRDRVIANATGSLAGISPTVSIVISGDKREAKQIATETLNKTRIESKYTRSLLQEQRANASVALYTARLKVSNLEQALNEMNARNTQRSGQMDDVEALKAQLDAETLKSELNKARIKFVARQSEYNALFGNMTEPAAVLPDQITEEWVIKLIQNEMPDIQASSVSLFLNMLKQDTQLQQMMLDFAKKGRRELNLIVPLSPFDVRNAGYAVVNTVNLVRFVFAKPKTNERLAAEMDTFRKRITEYEQKGLTKKAEELKKKVSVYERQRVEEQNIRDLLNRRISEYENRAAQDRIQVIEKLRDIAIRLELTKRDAETLREYGRIVVEARGLGVTQQEIDNAVRGVRARAAGAGALEQGQATRDGLIAAARNILARPLNVAVAGEARGIRELDLSQSLAQIDIATGQFNRVNQGRRINASMSLMRSDRPDTNKSYGVLGSADVPLWSRLKTTERRMGALDVERAQAGLARDIEGFNTQADSMNFIVKQSKETMDSLRSDLEKSRGRSNTILSQLMTSATGTASDLELQTVLQAELQAYRELLSDYYDALKNYNDANSELSMLGLGQAM